MNRPFRTLASPVRYAGAPNPRCWTFEDAAINFGDISAPVESSTTSLVLEYALVYSNDHYLIPMVVPVGELRRVTRLIVTDTFGERVLIPAAAEMPRNGPFRLFEHSTSSGRDPLFAVIPTIAHPTLGDPIEDVHYLREEATELVWAVEETALGGAAGERVDRSAASRPRYRDLLPPATTATGDPLQLTYYPRTDVEENWYAFGLPFPTDAGTAGTVMPYVAIRALDGSERPSPWGAVLQAKLDPAAATLGLAQEEVTREGVRVSRIWRSARRWTDGSHYVWVSRRIRPRRGEGISGLRFDVEK